MGPLLPIIDPGNLGMTLDTTYVQFRHEMAQMMRYHLPTESGSREKGICLEPEFGQDICDLKQSPYGKNHHLPEVGGY